MDKKQLAVIACNNIITVLEQQADIKKDHNKNIKKKLANAFKVYQQDLLAQ